MQNIQTMRRPRIVCESEWVYVPVEAIIDEDLWNRCNAQLAARVKRQYRPARKPVHFFSGVVFCEGDGSKMYPRSKLSYKYTRRTCGRAIRADDQPTWEKLEADERRVVVDAVKRITVGEEEVSIEMEYKPPFDEAGVSWQRTPALSHFRTPPLHSAPATTYLADSGFACPGSTR